MINGDLERGREGDDHPMTIETYCSSYCSFMCIYIYYVAMHAAACTTLYNHTLQTVCLQLHVVPGSPYWKIKKPITRRERVPLTGEIAEYKLCRRHGFLEVPSVFNTIQFHSPLMSNLWLMCVETVFCVCMCVGKCCVCVWTLVNL